MKEHVRRDVAWPADPAKYPLNDPGAGKPTYCPPTEQYEPWDTYSLANWVAGVFIAIVILVALVFGFALIDYFFLDY